jgi:hypothetical protein
MLARGVVLIEEEKEVVGITNEFITLAISLYFFLTFRLQSSLSFHGIF